MVLTPGIKFLFTNSPKVFVPLLFAYTVRYGLSAYYKISISNVVFFFAILASFPLLLTARLTWNELSERREAVSLGGVRLKSWDGRLPGNIDVLLVWLKRFDTGYPAEGWDELANRIGNAFIVRLLWWTQIMTFEPDHIKAMLATDFNRFEKGSKVNETLGSVLGLGVFNSDGDMWKFHRSMTRPFFSKDRISHFDIFGRHADEAITLMKERFRAGYAIDFQDLVSRFTLDSATEFLFGSCVNSLHAGLPYPHNAPIHLTRSPNAAERFSNAFLDAQAIVAARARRPLWQLKEIFGDETKESMRIVNAHIDPIVRRALERKRELKGRGTVLNEKDLEASEDAESLLDHLVNLTEDPVILRDETLNIMIAGRDTTALTLSAAIYLLTMHPDVLARLRKEILDTVGPTRRPTYDDIKTMKYLRAFINETLRLYPAVPFNTRNSIKATTLSPITPGGKPIYVPAKTSVIYSVMVMHRRKDLWGPDAEEFDPDRFLDERVRKYLTPNPFIFLPFNAGPRICLGQQFAYNEASFMLIRLLQQFSQITYDADAQPSEGKPAAYWAKEPGRQSIEKLRWKNHLTMYAHGGVWVRMREAEVVSPTKEA